MTSTPNDEIYHNLLFPLPYRILLLCGLGIFGWATNLHGLDTLGIDPVAAMDLRVEPGHFRTPMPVHLRAPNYNPNFAQGLYHTAYRIFYAYAGFCFASWSLYRLVSQGDVRKVDSFGFIPVVTAIILIAVLVCPYEIAWRSERVKFTQAVRRCVYPPKGGPIYFADVILADIGTSFARVLGDLWHSLWMLKPGNSIVILPTPEGWLRWVLPLAMSLPFLVRFRQCLIEFNAADSDSRRPLFNALKYATSFPVIFLSAAQRLVISDLERDNGLKAGKGSWHGQHPLFRLWLLAAVVNSLYSFWWDVTNDWGLDLLRFEPSTKSRKKAPKPLLLANIHATSPAPTGHNGRQPPDAFSETHYPMTPFQQLPKYRPRQSCYGLRSVLFYPRAVYPVVIFLNLVLRMTWSVRLSSHVSAATDGTLAFFWLEVAEIVRRWLWVFFRVEWEVIKTSEEDHLTGPVAEDDSEFEMVPTTPELLLADS